MSENLIHVSVAQEIEALAQLADAQCSDFQHEILNSASSYAGPGNVTIFTIIIPENAAFIMTALDIEMVPLISDPIFDGGDYRSTADLNPFGPQFAGSGGSGVIVINDNGQGVFAVANGMGVINTPLLLVFGGGHTITVLVNPQQPAAKTLTSVNRITGYLVPQEIGNELKKKESRILTGTGTTGTIQL